jgi:hypothetical protein
MEKVRNASEPRHVQRRLGDTQGQRLGPLESDEGWATDRYRADNRDDPRHPASTLGAPRVRSEPGR